MCVHVIRGRYDSGVAMVPKKRVGGEPVLSLRCQKTAKRNLKLFITLLYHNSFRLHPSRAMLQRLINAILCGLLFLAHRKILFISFQLSGLLVKPDRCGAMRQSKSNRTTLCQTHVVPTTYPGPRAKSAAPACCGRTGPDPPSRKRR